MTRKLIRERIEDSMLAGRSLFGEQEEAIERASALIIRAVKKGNKLLVFGNGGSAADSQHIAAELVGRFKKERRGLPVIALTTNSSTVTAIANDYSYEDIFARQVEAFGARGDAVLGISTSGNSKNVILAVRKARALGMKTIILTGALGGLLKKESDVAIVVDSRDTPRIQEVHILVGHIICEIVENAVCGH